jgi:ABC-type nitrate/sulfonate/bicarbonate transport system permease component
MWDALPSLLHAHWKTWDDARHWWSAGEPESAAAAAEPPAPGLDWRRPNDAPFQLTNAALVRLIGPHWKEWRLLQAVLWSTLRIAIGFFYAALFAVPLGLLMGSFSKPRGFFAPLVLIGSYLPLPALYPLTLFWWEIGESQKIGFLAICSFVVLLPQVIMAVQAIPQEHVSAALTLGATRWQQMRHVLLAGAKADIMRALRISFAVGWTWIIVAEGVNPEAGLGYVIALGQGRGQRAHIYAVVLLIVALAWVANSLWAWLERRLYPYREEA